MNFIYKMTSPTDEKRNDYSNIPMLQYVPLILCTQGALLRDQQTLRGDSRHEDKHY